MRSLVVGGDGGGVAVSWGSIRSSAAWAALAALADPADRRTWRRCSLTKW
jgi:hypothetical protein